MTSAAEIAAITAHLTDAGCSPSTITYGLTIAEINEAVGADETLSLALGAVLGEPGDRHPVEPGFVAALLSKEPRA